MTKEQKKKYKQELLNEEFRKIPELIRIEKLYRVVTRGWIIFSIIYAFSAVAMLLYMGNLNLIASSVLIPAAALLCVYFIGTGMKGIVIITLIGGMFEVYRGYLCISVNGMSYGRMYFVYMIAVIIQGAVTLGISLFVLSSPKLGQYISALKRINNKILIAR
ncbi:MAG: hypothetical protein ACI4QV_06615 [Acutalibacteraceae bacterium]